MIGGEALLFNLMFPTATYTFLLKVHAYCLEIILLLFTAHKNKTLTTVSQYGVEVSLPCLNKISLNIPDLPMKAQGVDKTQFWCGNRGSCLQSTDTDSGWFKAKGIYWKDARSSQSWQVSGRPSLKETGEIGTWKSGIKDCRRNEHTAERVWLPPGVIQLWSYTVCLLLCSRFKFQGTSVQLALDHMNTPFIGDSRVLD